jgi:hypothetical protein
MISLLYICVNLASELLAFSRATPVQRSRLRHLYNVAPVSYLVMTTFTAAPTYVAGLAWKALT